MEDVDDIIIEAVEVLLNHILYIRDVYPAHIFKKKRLYNTPVYVPAYPQLNSYLSQVLQTCRELIKQKQLRCVEVKLYRDTNLEYESYIIELKALTHCNEDSFLIDFEEQMRKCLDKMAERLNGLEKLPSNVKHKILIHTTNAAFVKLGHNPHYQDFPWHLTDLNQKSGKKGVSLLPLTSVKTLCLSLMVDIF